MANINEKKIKEELRKKAQKDPEKYYPVSFLKDKGYMRKKCKVCGNYFWTLDAEREVCGDPQCIGKYEFINNPSNTNIKLDFIASWKIFSKIFKKLGYTPIKRYPVLARWRDDMDFVITSIADFQPYVVKGIVDPPANPLVVPQFCMRFTDIDNVGYTGRHYTGFVMIGQHTFVPKEEYDKERYLSEIHYFLTNGLGIKEEEIIYHEDAWAGGGNLGPSMEFFSRGLEIGNQVYMQYEITSEGGIKPLEISVLDMGMGQERVAWFSQGTHTSYEANFPTVMDYLYTKTGYKPNKELWSKFLPYSALLNIDEVVDIDKVWDSISEKIGVEKHILKKEIEPIASLYAIGEHLRTLLVAISDGAIPSNVGGGYNLRVIARRSFDLINRFKFDVDIKDIIERHAKYLKPQYPELMENLDSVFLIMDVEYRKYLKSKEKAKQIVSNLKGKRITIEDMVSLYDTHGISPQVLKEEGLIQEVPDNFYQLVSDRHEKKSQKAQTRKEVPIDVSDVKDTDILYWGDWRLVEFDAKVVKVDGNYVVLDRTAFYPTSGGQLHDTGVLVVNGREYRVIDVIKKDNVVVHVLEDASELKKGMKVKGKVDFERRMQHAQHHTATHILNDACRKVLGKHIWQAGAEKTVEKARLDITHYELPSFEQIQEIERVANEIVLRNLPVNKYIMKRNEAEEKYGFRIYQGGAPPGKYLRIVEVGEDVEACGGTHLNYSLEAGLIKIISVSKIQDGIIRFEFVAGKKALEYVQKMEGLLRESSQVFNVSYEQLPSASKRFFEEWKRQRKEIEKLKEYKREVLKQEVLRSVKENQGYRIAWISGEVDIRDLHTIINDINVDAIVVSQEKGKLLISRDKNAEEIAKKIFKEGEIKGKGKVVYII